MKKLPFLRSRRYMYKSCAKKRINRNAHKTDPFGRGKAGRLRVEQLLLGDVKYVTMTRAVSRASKQRMKARLLGL